MICDIHYRVLNQPRLCLRPQGYRWISIKFRRVSTLQCPQKNPTPLQNPEVVESKKKGENMRLYGILRCFFFSRYCYIFWGTSTWTTNPSNPFFRSCSINSVVSASDGEVCKSRNPNATYVDTGAKTRRKRCWDQTDTAANTKSSTIINFFELDHYIVCIIFPKKLTST